MSAATFDTHAFIKRLVAAGMPEQQAETVTDMVRSAQDAASGGLATRADIRDIEAKIDAAKFDLLRWVVGLALAQMGLIVGVLLKLSH